eukprot:m.166633 g.166633  ORF g.166633 m.166633 type:complete len:133 (-) comp14445_c0_seq2:151-549(-)
MIGVIPVFVFAEKPISELLLEYSSSPGIFLMPSRSHIVVYVGDTATFVFVRVVVVGCGGGGGGGVVTTLLYPDIHIPTFLKEICLPSNTRCHKMQPQQTSLAAKIGTAVNASEQCHKVRTACVAMLGEKAIH